tara:strand:+ start:389 stop:586 length:198 start_codon:yes stop_codon:yes gene_type:complete
MTIDLSGPDGNAFALMGYAKKLGRQLGFNRGEIQEIIDLMKNGDYQNLLEVFKEYFGEHVTIIGE